jgi:cell volume regulation protein A
LITLTAFVLTVFAIFSLSYWVWGLDLLYSIFLGIAFGNISGAIVIPIMLRLNVKESAKTILSLEAAIVDMLCVVAAIVLLHIAATGLYKVTFTEVFNKFAGQFSIAIVIGAIAGLVWIKFLEFATVAPLSYMTTMAATLLVYSVTEFALGNGPMAVLTFGLVLKNGERFLQVFTPGKKFSLDTKILEFNQEFTFFIRTYFFVYIGILINFARFEPMWILYSLGIFGAIIICRLISVKFSGLISSEIRQNFPLFFAMLPRGLVVAVLAGLAIAKGLWQTESLIFHVFCVILLTNLFVTLMIFFTLRRHPA